MTQKDSKKKAVEDKTPQAEPENPINKVWSYIRYFYLQNEQLWQRCLQYEKDITELRSLIKEAA